MRISLSASKIVKSEFEKAISSKKWFSKLLSGDFYGFEQSLYKWLLELYDKICELMLKELSKSAIFDKIQRELAIEKGLKKLKTREVEIQLRTGTKVRLDSLYGKKAPKGYEGSRHLSHLFWKTEKKSGPMYQSLTCLLSVICPSFLLSKELLNYQGIHANFDRVRTLSLIHI